ncbi:YpoC family protein [Bacillus cihuensis]|uniref:YpoC family protein n=1 Tax=Bacillus cihuensis TaxID=1208599 RepID=UPI00041A0F5C|nr:hypothetical protein [Bacillus cihuensis]
MIVKLPQKLLHEKFFFSDMIEIDHSSFDKWDPSFNPALFVYDMLYWSGGQGFQPWQQGHLTIPVLFEKWKEIANTCKIIIDERRQKDAELFMKKGMALFFQALFWINEQPVVLYNWYESVDKLSIKPINVVERLSFVELRMTHYVSFIQLSELFLEAEKQYYKTIAMKKRYQK